MPAKNLIIGFDGMDLDLVHRFGPEVMPNLFAQMSRGVVARLESVKPPATLPNWASFLCAADPAEHGVFDFTSRDDYGVRFSGGTIRELPTILARLDAIGKRCACLAFPGTWPPEQLEHGVFMSGWDSPVAFKADASFVHPPEFYKSVVQRFGVPTFDDVNEFEADKAGWHERLPSALESRIEKKGELCSWMLKEDWFAFAVYFGESDTASHHLYSLHDANSPRHVHGMASDGLQRVYAALDHQLGQLLRLAGDCELTIVSDHGSGGSSDKILYLNRALAEAGVLRFGKSGSGLFTKAKSTALRVLPPLLKEKLFNFAGGVLPNMVESNARFGAIDFSATRAFSDELNYFPAIHFNELGRESEGIVDASHRAELFAELRQVLGQIRDPWTGQNVVREVWRREDLFSGPYLERAPDVLLEFELDAGYSYNLAPSAGPGPIWTKIEASEFLGRKGRSMPGAHRNHGIYVASGPQIHGRGSIELSMPQAGALTLLRAGMRPPSVQQLPWHILALEGARVDLSRVSMTKSPVFDERIAARHLRKLGYID